MKPYGISITGPTVIAKSVFILPTVEVILTFKTLPNASFEAVLLLREGRKCISVSSDTVLAQEKHAPSVLRTKIASYLGQKRNSQIEIFLDWNSEEKRPIARVRFLVGSTYRGLGSICLKELSRFVVPMYIFDETEKSQSIEHKTRRLKQLAQYIYHHENERKNWVFMMLVANATRETA